MPQGSFPCCACSVGRAQGFGKCQSAAAARVPSRPAWRRAGPTRNGALPAGGAEAGLAGIAAGEGGTQAGALEEWGPAAAASHAQLSGLATLGADTLGFSGEFAARCLSARGVAPLAVLLARPTGASMPL